MDPSPKKLKMKEESSTPELISGPNLAERLPNEVMYEIFRRVPLPALTKLELVCKHWKSIIRYHQSLWKESFLQEDVAFEQKDFCALHSFQIVPKLIERNGGKLSSVFLPISLKHVNNEDIEAILNALPASEVQHLWIVMGAELHCCHTHQCRRRSWIATPYKRMVKMVIKAVTQCSKLKTLRLVSTKDVSIVTHKPKKSPEWPLANCKLDRLSLIGITIGSLFVDETMFATLSALRTLEIANEAETKNEEEMAEATRVLRALEVSKDTLDECRLLCSFYHLDKAAKEHELLRQPKGALWFSNLKKLTLNFERGFSDICWLDYSNVRHLNLQGLRDPTAILKVPKAEMLTTLQVEVPLQVSELAKCLEQYKLLQHLSIRFSVASKGPVFFCEIKHTLMNLPLEELTVHGKLEHQGDEIVDLVRARKSNLSSTKIKTVTVARCKNVNFTNKRWLEENVENLQIWDWKISNGVNRINYEYEGLHFFEVESSRLRAMVDPSSKRYS
ncbi:uncharacterized protein FA14DRAFT_180657 [Meira miltonrushii]|uniref:F-box domain-containing protein n=1 Tax=Meira miltonrushii TaxID=1280837 RepID=A0A316VCR9_9BASI|nr:uncharacterized protein FA14DRAFT_180657 [Meira miltonrushii]PWN34023.1 hypothetical protein FA14DRAFT_180657 [Meira miltonrushii]